MVIYLGQDTDVSLLKGEIFYDRRKTQPFCRMRVFLRRGSTPYAAVIAVVCCLHCLESTTSSRIVKRFLAMTTLTLTLTLIRPVHRSF